MQYEALLVEVVALAGKDLFPRGALMIVRILRVLAPFRHVRAQLDTEKWKIQDKMITSLNIIIGAFLIQGGERKVGGKKNPTV